MTKSKVLKKDYIGATPKLTDEKPTLEQKAVAMGIPAGTSGRLALHQADKPAPKKRGRPPKPKFGTLKEYGTPIEMEIVTSKEFMAHAIEAGKNNPSPKLPYIIDLGLDERRKNKPGRDIDDLMEYAGLKPKTRPDSPNTESKGIELSPSQEKALTTLLKHIHRSGADGRPRSLTNDITYIKQLLND